MLIRCAIEIEAISKDLYIQLGGNESPLDSSGQKCSLYFDTDCLKLLVDTWNLDKKRIQITNPNMYFSSSKTVLTPLHKSHKRGSSGSRWKRAYQSFKHQRSESISEASIENLLNALGALYILNLYYADDKYWMGTPIKDRKEYSVDSKIFTPFICRATGISMSKDMDDNSISSFCDSSLEESVFVLKLTDDAFRGVHEDVCKYTTSMIVKLQSSDEYKQYITEHPDGSSDPIEAICSEIGVDFVKFILQEIRAIGGLGSWFNKEEVVLVKSSSIYPQLLYDDYIQSDNGKKYMESLIKSIHGKKIHIPRKQ